MPHDGNEKVTQIPIWKSILYYSRRESLDIDCYNMFRVYQCKGLRRDISGKQWDHSSNKSPWRPHPILNGKEKINVSSTWPKTFGATSFKHNTNLEDWVLLAETLWWCNVLDRASTKPSLTCWGDFQGECDNLEVALRRLVCLRSHVQFTYVRGHVGRPRRRNYTWLLVIQAAGNATSLASQRKTHVAARSNKVMDFPREAIGSGWFGIFRGKTHA